MASKKLLHLSPILALLTCSGLPAEAADSRSLNRSVATHPTLQPADSDSSQGYFFDLHSFGSSFGQELGSHGIYITGRTLDQGLGNVSGGLKRGGFYEGYTSLGVDLDMNRIFGISGGAIHFLADDLSGKDYQPYSGSLYAYDTIWGYGSGVRLNEFSYEQSLFNGNLDVRIGRIPLTQAFDFSDVYCEFLSGLCGPPPAFAFNKGYPAYLTSVWGGIAHIKLPNSFYANIGVYEDEPSMADRNHFGWPGEDWAFSKGTGVTIPVQFGYQTDYKTDPYPRAFSVGAFYDTENYNDPLFNAHGLNRTLYGGAAKTDTGKSQIWVQAEQMVWRPDMKTDRGLKVFGAANFTPSGEPNIQTSFLIGLSMKGLYETRPNDTINFLAEAIQLNPNYVTSVNSNLRMRGIYQSVNSTEYTLELNYGMALAPGVTFKPFINYILNPDQVGFSTPSANNTHSLFIGAAISAIFPETFGLPRLKIGS